MSPDGRGFELALSHRKFTPWGFNYDHDASGRLIEDYWDAEWTRVARDFRDMKAMGATVVRIHLQLGRFMKGPDLPDPGALGRLGRLLRLAEELGLYLDLTGLGCYRKADTPPWYEEASEQDRWAAQARFWEAVASTCAGSPAVFCYNLMNEPVSPGGPSGGWHGGEPLGGFYYVEQLSQDPGKRSRPELTRQWIRALAAGIRRRDSERMITCGMFFIFDVPTGLTLGPEVREFSGDLDFLSVHLYPADDNWTTLLKLLSTLRIGKPVVIEEMFPLRCGMESFRKFVAGSRATASGWIGFYWGKSLDECRRSGELKDAIVATWLEYFEAEARNMNP